MPLARFPTADAFWDAVFDPSVPARYRARIDRSTPYNGLGDAGVALYLSAKERDLRDAAAAAVRGDAAAPAFPPRRYLRDLRAAYRVAGTVAASIRVVDDILDGHATPPLPQEDRPRFRENYIAAVRDGAVGDGPDHPLIHVAYRSGRILHDAIDDPAVLADVTGRLEEMGDLIEREDKSSLEGWVRASRADSAGYTKLIVDAMRTLPTFDPDPEFYDAAHAYGMGYGAADDVLDGDVDLPPEDLEAFYRAAFARLGDHRGLFFQATSKLMLYSPAVYSIALDVGRLQKRVAG